MELQDIPIIGRPAFELVEIIKEIKDNTHPLHVIACLIITITFIGGYNFWIPFQYTPIGLILFGSLMVAGNILKDQK